MMQSGLERMMSDVWRPALGNLAKRAYVGLIRGLRAVLKPLGLLALLERGTSRWARWLRSLFAIYDFDDLSRLDLPWWTFDAIERVDGFLAAHPSARVFEWGSGASTVWLSRRAGWVTSVEHDATFSALVHARMKDLDHVTLHSIEPDTEGQISSSKPGWEGLGFDRYVQAIDDAEGPFDLIVIDGRAREACLRQASGKLAPGGMIVFDNAGRERYLRAIEASPFTVEMTRGLTTCLPYPDATALLTVRA
jgi:predicted O-methyltransferase YrrM